MGCVTALWFSTRPCSLWNLENSLWMTKTEFDVRQILSPKYFIKNVTSFKNHNCNPFHSFLSVSIRFSLLLFIPSLNALSGDFYISFNLVEVPTFGILSKCCDTAHLTFNLHFWFSKLWCSQLCKKEAFCATKVN